MIPLREQPDTELVKLAKAKDLLAFSELVSRHSARIYSLLYRLLKNRGDAEDLLQQTFLSAFENLGRFREEASFRTWVTRIATNFALMKFRKEKKNQTVSLDVPKNFTEDGIPLPMEIADWSVNPVETLERKELVEILEAAIARLPQIYRTVFLLRDLEGLSNKEVAEMMELSVSAVKSRLMRARLFLRTILSDLLREKVDAL
ncbi:MAG: sigma-70 family RNA polymerase sigma factor [bacterium]